MPTNRLEAFSDGVIAIIITIMVLELKVPHGADWAALRPLLPVFLSYILSFVYVAIYWNNHHHLLHATKVIDGRIMWANMHLLFWLTLFPFCTAWLGENHWMPMPAAVYGFVLLMAAIAYALLQRAILANEGKQSLLGQALGSDWKGKLSPVFYLIAIPLCFWNPWVSMSLYTLVALMWVIPDRRIERKVDG